MDQNLKKKLKRNIKLNYLNTFITNLNMQSCIWMLYLAYCGLNLTEIGMIEGMYHATSILFEIPSGALADLLGRKKSMILSKLCIAISCMIMLLSKNFWLFMLSFIIQALGNNLNSGSEEALIYDSMKYIDQEQNYIGVSGRLNIIVEIAQGIATVVGGILAEYSYFFCYSACLCIAGLAFFPVLLMKEAPYSSENTKKRQASFLKMTKHHFLTCYHILKSDQRILQIITYYSVIFASYTLLFFYSQQYYSNLNYNKIQISIIFLLNGIISCFGAAISEKLFQKYGKNLAFLAGLIMIFIFFLYGSGHTVISIIAFMIAGFCDSVLYPIQTESLNQLIPSEQRATLISVNSMFFSIVMIIIFPIAGKIADFLGLVSIFPIIGTILLLFIIGWNLWNRK